MSNAEQGFLSAIRADPGDDGVRLIYADWLQENGQAERAEFIRVQIELARLANDDPRRESLADRQDELLAAHGDEWCSAFHYRHPPEHARFCRGFLEEAVLHTEEEARDVLRSTPLRRLHLRKATAKGLATIARLPAFVQVRELIVEAADRRSLNLKKLLASPHLGQLESLKLSSVGRVTDIFGALASSPHMQALTRLGITSRNLGDEALDVLARSPLLGRLTGLYFHSNEIHLAGVQALLGSPLAAGLTSLALFTNSELGDAGGHAFAAATHLRHLERLHLSFCNLGPDGAAALASAEHLDSLRRLDLSDNELRDEGVRAIALAPQWAGLRELELSSNDIGPEGMGWLARAPFWRGLTKLSLSDASFDGLAGRTFLGDPGAAALAGSPSLEQLDFWACTLSPRGVWELAGRAFPRLEALSLSCNRMGDEGLAVLLKRGRFLRLSRLDVKVTELTAAGVRALAESALLDRLRELDLSANNIGDEGAAALAASPRTSRLRRLELNECGIGEEGARALAASPHLKRLQWVNLYQETRLPQDGPTAAALLRSFGNRVWF